MRVYTYSIYILCIFLLEHEDFPAFSSQAQPTPAYWLFATALITNDHLSWAHVVLHEHHETI